MVPRVTFECYLGRVRELFPRLITLSIEIKGWGLVVGQESSILVTGAEGFIGSHVVEVLAKSGINVRALCQYNSFGSIGWLGELSSEFSDNVEIVFGDVRDADQMRRYVKGCSSVVNLAALIAIPYSYLAGRSYADVNTLGTLNLLEAVRENNIRMIQISTSEIYGTPQTTPITELHPVNPQSPYAASKAAADHFVMSYFDSFDMDLLIVRPFNTYGPRQSSRAVIPTILSQLVFGAPTLQIGSLTAKRDFTFVSDTAEAIVKAINSDVQGEIIQLGTGSAVSVLELIEMCQSICGTNIEVVEDLQRIRPKKSEVEILLSDPSKARDYLEWQSRVDLHSGLEQTRNWIENNPNAFRDFQNYRI